MTYVRQAESHPEPPVVILAPNHLSLKRRLVVQEEKLELQPEFDRKLAKRIKLAGKSGELNFMMEGLNYFPMGVFQEEVSCEGA